MIDISLKFGGGPSKNFLNYFVFLVMLGLCCYADFSLVSESRGCAQAFHGGGFIVGLLGMQTSVVAAPGPSCSSACGIFPNQGSNLSPALAGKFFTIETPGNPPSIIFKRVYRGATPLKFETFHFKQ